METGFHPPLEEYVEAIFSLEEEGIAVIQARIAERVGVRAPSASQMLDRMGEQGLVLRTGRIVSLTQGGKALATKVIRRHRLAERLLVDVIGLEWHKVHNEAGRWEHVISDDVEEKLIVLLGDPSTCPHGNPIPGSQKIQSEVELTPLADVLPGARIRLERVSEKLELDIDILEFLNLNGFIPGALATVEERSEDGSIVVNVKGTPFTCNESLSRCLFVTEL